MSPSHHIDREGLEWPPSTERRGTCLAEESGEHFGIALEGAPLVSPTLGRHASPPEAEIQGWWCEVVPVAGAAQNGRKAAAMDRLPRGERVLFCPVLGGGENEGEGCEEDKEEKTRHCARSSSQWQWRFQDYFVQKSEKVPECEARESDREAGALTSSDQ